MRRAIGLGLALLLLTQGVSLAQPRGSSRAEPPAASKPPELPPSAPPPEAPPPPYEKDLLRLSELLGSLAFLRSLCGGADAAEWQKRMQALMDAEGAVPARRDRLAGAYNRGYRGYAVTYRQCTPSAAEATGRYLKEGEDLSRSLAGRYGG